MSRQEEMAFRIAFAVNRLNAGVSPDDICEMSGVSNSTLVSWRRRYGGLRPSEVRHLRRLESENRKLKQQVADLILEIDRAKDFEPIRLEQGHV
jgi:putative transposase